MQKRKTTSRTWPWRLTTYISNLPCSQIQKRAEAIRRQVRLPVGEVDDRRGDLTTLVAGGNMTLVTYSGACLRQRSVRDRVARTRPRGGDKCRIKTRPSRAARLSS